MIPILQLRVAEDKKRVEKLLDHLAVDPGDDAVVREILADVKKRGDAALVESSKKFDDLEFTAEQIRVKPAEIADASSRITSDQRSALQRSIAQVREYQTHVIPHDPPPLKREGVELGLRFTPLDSAGLYIPGGKAAYPSSVIMMAVPAQVAGVKRIAVCTPPSKYGRSDLVLAACHELKLTEVYRAGGAAAVAALAFGTKSIRAVDKIVGPGNSYVQMAKRAVAGVVGIDGFLGPSEILVLADESGRAEFIAADLLAQAEHDPGSCFLLTTSTNLAFEVIAQIEKQLPGLSRKVAIMKALRNCSAIIVDKSMDILVDLANRFAAEHVNIQCQDDAEVLKHLHHAGAIFVGPYAPIAAGDYVAGPSHCLPTNTTARFTSGISVYEFLKRSSVARYSATGLAGDAESIVTLAEAEQLDAHAASVEVRKAKS